MDPLKKIEKLEKALKEEKNANQKLSQLLKEKTDELDGIFNTIIEAYVMIDVNGYVQNMNDAALKLLGLNHENKKINILDLVTKEYIAYTKNAFKTLFQEGSFYNYKAVINTKDNKERIVQINASVIYNKKGESVGAQGIVRDITLETKLQEEHEEQKRQLNIVMDYAPIGISLSNSNFKNILLANKTLSKMLGYTPEELASLGPKDLTYHEDHKESLAYFEDLIAGKIDSYVVEKRYVKKDGNLIWVKTSAKAVRGRNNKMLYQVATLEDISKEKEALSKLKESENRLATLITNLNTGILLEDENRKILLTNKRFCNMFGIEAPPEALKGLDCSNAAEENKVYFKDPKKFVKRIETLLQQKKAVSNDELFLKDGRIFERSYIPIYHQNTYKGHLWSYNDVTIQKKYKDSLKAQKEKYSSIIANMNLGLLENNSKDEIIFSNQSFSEMSGYSEEELIGKKAIDLFLTKESYPEYFNRVKEREPNSPDSFELTVKNKKGDIRHWLISTAPNFNVKGNKIGSIGIHLDITRLKELEKQKEELLSNLEKQNERLNEYAHIVSHDLKSPLRNISALLSWTKEDFQDRLGKESLTNLDLIQEKVEKMDHLIENILKYSSIESDILTEENIDLNELINIIEEMIYIPSHIHLKVKSKLPTIYADKTRIQQVFQNLISNAVNYIDKEEGKVEIDYSTTKTHYVFSVKDNGIGIAKEHFEKIFKIFNSLGNHAQSTGIGLSIVQKVVHLYNGEVWLESKEGEGTTFFFSIEKNK